MKRPVLAWMLPLCAALGLRAEFPMVGVQAATVSSLKDLKTYADGQRGTDLGLHMTFDQGDGLVLRPRLDMESHGEVTVKGRKQKASQVALGGDLLFFTEGVPERLYVFLGASLGAWSLKGAPGEATQKDGTPLPTSATKVSLGVGVGYQWSALLGTELRYTHGKPASAFTADTLQAGITLRF